MLSKGLPIIQKGSIIHPAALNKTAGLKWPIFPAHQMLLRKMLSVLVKTHHCIAFYDNRYHNINHHLGLAMTEDLTKMVSPYANVISYFHVYVIVQYSEEERYLDYRIDVTEKINRKMEGVRLMQVQSKDWLRRMRFCINMLRNKEPNARKILRCSVCHYSSI